MSSDLARRVEALERRLKVLEEERAILSTLYTYGHTIDYGLKAEWLDCFTEDAVYKVQAFGVTPPEVFVPQPSTGLKVRSQTSHSIILYDVLCFPVRRWQAFRIWLCWVVPYRAEQFVGKMSAMPQLCRRNWCGDWQSDALGVLAGNSTINQNDVSFNGKQILVLISGAASSVTFGGVIGL